MATMDIRTNGTALFTVKCDTHPSGIMVVVLTKQIARHGNRVPEKLCAQCGRSWPLHAYIKASISYVDKHGYYQILDSRICFRCEDPGIFRLHKEDGKLRTHICLRDGSGRPVDAWDRSTNRWRTLDSMGWRLMTPDGNEIRLQPITIRKSKKAKT